MLLHVFKAIPTPARASPGPLSSPHSASAPAPVSHDPLLNSAQIVGVFLVLRWHVGNHRIIKIGKDA